MTPQEALEFSGYTLRALGALKAYWDDHRNNLDWSDVLAEFAQPGRIEALVTATMLLAERAGLTGPELTEWGNDLIAQGRSG